VREERERESEREGGREKMGEIGNESERGGGRDISPSQ